MQASTESLALPVTNICSAITPSVLTPLLPRFAYIESLVLLSSPSALLLRLGLDTKKIVLIWGAVLLTLGHRRSWKEWRMAVEVLGVVEGLGRTVGLLESLELLGRAEEDTNKERDDRELQERRVQLYNSSRHVLSFWVFYASLTALERIAWTNAPSAHTSTTRQLKVRARHLQFQAYQMCIPPYLRLRQLLTACREKLSTLPPPPISLPSFSLPTLPSIFSISSFSLLPSRPFPQPPTSRSSKVLVPPPPTTPAVVPLIKLLLLLYSLRTDGKGASMIWDWIVGPYMAVRRRRKVLGPQVKKRSSWVIRLEEATSATNEILSSPPTPPRTDTSATSQQPSFPTPSHVPYRLTSSTHPIHARLLSPEYNDSSPTPSPSSSRISRDHYGSDGASESGEEMSHRQGKGEWDDTWTS